MKELRLDVLALRFARGQRLLLQVDVRHEPRHFFEHFLRHRRQVDKKPVFVFVERNLAVQQDSRNILVVLFREGFHTVA